MLIIPAVTMLYLFSSLDKSNVGNAKVMGMMSDIGKDPDGTHYALLSALFGVSYAPFSEPMANATDMPD